MLIINLVSPIEKGVGFLRTFVEFSLKGKLFLLPGKLGEMFANRIHVKRISEALSLEWVH